MPKQTVPLNARGLDFALVQTGKAAVSARAVALIDNVHHQLFCRKKRGITLAYQVSDGEVSNPTRLAASSADHVWRFLPGRGTRYITIRVLTLGAKQGGARPGFTVTTTTDADATVTYPHDGPAPGTTIAPSALQEWEFIREVTPDTLETITVAQSAAAPACVYILAIDVEEFPVSMVDTAVDTWTMDKAEVATGTDIIAHATSPVLIPRDYNGLPVLCQTLRRYGKQFLWSHGKEHSTTSVAAYDFLAYAAAASSISWNVFSTPCLPETAAVSVACRVYAEADVVNNGTVRFAFSGGNIDIANITTGGPAWYANTAGTIVPVGDSFSFQGWNTAAGTLTVYSAEIYAQVEAT